MSVSPVPSIEKSSLIEVSAVVLEIAFLRIIYSPVLFLIESAWAVNPSAFANVIISFDTISIACLRIIYSPVLLLIEYAWAVIPSAFANVIISFDTTSNACSEYCIMLDLLIKSYTPNGEENVAVPLVGKVWFGPAT